MAYAAVASLSETIDIILNHHQAYTTPQFQNQITSLQKHSVFLQFFVEDFPDLANNWDETIREVTDRAEEIVELLLSDSFLESISSVGSLRKWKYEVHYDFRELERVTEELEFVANRVKGVSDEEVMEIISRLRGGSTALETISVVGMIGAGKTTLARKAYNHPLIMDHFDVHAWSTISIDHEDEPSRVAVDLLRSIKVDQDTEEEEIIFEIVRRSLHGRRYLIVLDDVWNSEMWDKLITMLPDGGNGSRIILTTRSYDLASFASTHIHYARYLDAEQSWDMIQKIVFKGDPCPAQLESVGKKIARSCRGHPLSIELVSGVLAAADPTQAAWEDVLENMNIAYEEDFRVRLVRILSASYMYLPRHLRPCFLYLGLFPKDHEIHVSELIKLWVAEGFLNESEWKSFEETGEECVNELVQRSLIAVTKMRSNGRIKSVALHDDEMWEFCLRQARVDKFFLRESRIGSFDRHSVAMELQCCRRVSSCTYDDDFLEGVYGSTIRTIMLYVNRSEVGVISWSIGNVGLLRILDLSNANNYDLAVEIFDLFHLRYLAFHSGFSISEAISNLENLQTLIICPREDDGGMFGKLPEGIWRMPQLRHVIVFPFELHSPKGVTTSALENLQTLSRVVDFICSRENLEMIPNLKKMCIFFSKNSRDVVEDYELHNLIYLHNLEILKIEKDWSFGNEHKMSPRCAFPPSLKKLNLCGVQLPWEDLKIVASLPNLQVLKLRNHACIGKTWETSEGGFSQLTYLLIEESNLKHWITESSHFPRLKCLVLHRCLRLLEVPEEVSEFFSLEVIELDETNHSLLRSVYQIQEDRQCLWGGDDALEIRLL